MAEANCVNFSGFAGNSSSNYFNKNRDAWVIDTGATTHMTLDMTLFTSHSKLKQTSSVLLPDGMTKDVHHLGCIQLHPRLKLTNVLHILEFKYNLLSVSKLTSTSNISVTFHPNLCVLQDLSTKEVIAIGRCREDYTGWIVIHSIQSCCITLLFIPLLVILFVLHLFNQIKEILLNIPFGIID